MNLLVTGGTGFLGSYFTRFALREGAQDHVVVFDKYVDAGRIADVLDRVTIIEGDVSDAAAVERAIAEHKIDRIAHFAFILGSPSPGQMLPYVRVQCLGAANVFELARVAGVKRVMFASSVAAYGKQEANVLTEELLVNPVEPYGASKAWAEALGRHYTQELGLEVVSLRFGSTYGLGRAWRGSYSSGLLPVPEQLHYMARLDDAVRGVAIAMPRDGVMADWTYAGDAAQAAWLALTAEHLPRHVYNVCAEQRPIGDFTRAMREVLPLADIEVSDTEMPTRSHAHMDGGRLKSDLGFAPAFSMKAGITDYVERIRAYEAFAAG